MLYVVALCLGLIIFFIAVIAVKKKKVVSKAKAHPLNLGRHPYNRTVVTGTGDKLRYQLKLRE